MCGPCPFPCVLQHVCIEIRLQGNSMPVHSESVPNIHGGRLPEPAI